MARPKLIDYGIDDPMRPLFLEVCRPEIIETCNQRNEARALAEFDEEDSDDDFG